MNAEELLFGLLAIGGIFGLVSTGCIACLIPLIIGALGLIALSSGKPQ